jgi:hypothetical protein
MSPMMSGNPFRDRYAALAAEQTETIAAMQALIATIGRRQK